MLRVQLICAMHTTKFALFICLCFLLSFLLYFTSCISNNNLRSFNFSSLLFEILLFYLELTPKGCYLLWPPIIVLLLLLLLSLLLCVVASYMFSFKY